MKFLNMDSPLMVALRRLWDYMGLNMCFLLCCLPIVTIGSAHSAMFTAIRALGRDEPWLKLYFRTFFKSFKRPTILWIIMALIIVVTGMNTLSLVTINDEGSRVPMIVSLVCLGFAMCVCTTAFLLYSKFECTVFQLLRNSILTVIMYPIRCVVGCALIWAPVILFLVLAWLFVETLIYQILFWFSFASFVFSWLMKKPLAKMAGEEIPEKKKKKKGQKEEESEEEEIKEGEY